MLQLVICEQQSTNSLHWKALPHVKAIRSVTFDFIRTDEATFYDKTSEETDISQQDEISSCIKHCTAEMIRTLK